MESLEDNREALQRTNKARVEIITECFDYIKKATEEVESMDIPSIIDSIKVEVLRHTFDRDTYSASFAKFITLIDYRSYDGYLEKLFPRTEEMLYETNDLHYRDDTYINEKYPDKSKWDDIAAAKTVEFKKLAKEAYETKYSKTEHICCIARHYICRYSTIDTSAYIKEFREKNSTIWGKENIDILIKLFKDIPERFVGLLMQDVMQANVERQIDNNF